MKNQSINNLRTYEVDVQAKRKNKMQYFVLKSGTLILMLLATLLTLSQTHAQKIAAGYWHSVFICSDTGIPKSNGSNSNGQLGDGTTINKPTPLQVSGLTGITAMAGGHSFSLFLKSDSTVWACGNNVYGNLGDGTNVNKTYPVQVVGLTGITAIAAGASFSLFLKSDSTVWACGENDWGQLGDGTTINRNIPVQVSWITGITAISAGWSNSLFLKKNGTVYACGSNNTGQLGDGTTIAKLTPVQVSSLTGIKAIASGGTHSLFLKNAGTVWACGYNGNGELGDGTNIARLTPVPVSSLTGIKSIEAGTSHSLFLKNNGTVWACGYNGSGGLGDGTINNRSHAVQVSGLTGITAIGGGQEHSLFLKSNGTVWACGNNYHGQFGDGTTTNSLIPIQTLNSFPVCQNGGTSNVVCGCDCPPGTSGTLCEIVTSPPPTITSFSPSSGATGSSVTITGTGFNTTAAQNIVFFGATQAVVTAASAISLTVTVPIGSTYQYISVTNLALKLTTYSAKPFIVTLDGSISFGTKVDYAIGFLPSFLSLSDLDGDGKPDLTTASLGNNISVLRNNSTSSITSFDPKVDFIVGNGGSNSFSIGDLDGDGKPDLAITNYSNTISVLRNTSISGLVSFATKVDFASGASPSSVSIGDIDGDGKPDLAVANYGNGTISVFRNTSTSVSISFAPMVNFTTGGGPSSVCIGDIDSDGKPDLTVANYANNTVSILRNISSIGVINFASKVDFTTGSQDYSAIIGDIDGDGKPDIAVANYASNTVSILRNNSTSGSVSFVSKVDFTTGGGPYSINMGDIDGDGKPDLAIANSTSNATLSVLRNTSITGSISFEPKADFSTGIVPYSVCIGDINGDGKPDLASANQTSGNVSVLLQTVPLNIPTITSLSPSNGPVGTLVTITGTNLSNPTAITIGGVSAIPISNTGTSLVAMVMPGAVTGKIVITNTSGSDTSAANYFVTASVPPTAQQGNKLVGTGGAGVGGQGAAVCLSADGNTALVGGPGGNTGAVWVYIRTSNVWTQQGSNLVGTGGISASQGHSVSLSADGNTAIVGGFTDNAQQGAVWIFTRTGGVWSQQGSKLVGTGGTTDAGQGVSVSLSADGNTAIVGGYLNNSSEGAAWVYTRSSGVWSQQGNKLVGTGVVGQAAQGSAVCLSADGNTALVGGNEDNIGQGAAWVFTRSGGVWSQQGNKLVGTGSVGAARQGFSVSISADGNTAMLGGNEDNLGLGAAWVFTRNGGIWSQQGNKLVGLGNIGNSQQGQSVSISADGNTAIVGGWNDNFQNGSAWVYKRIGSVWSQQGNKMVGTGAIGAALQGSGISISADGNTAMVGGQQDNSSTGAAWVFSSIAATLPTITSFTPSSGPVGTLVTITGTNLSNPTSIKIDGVNAIPISNTDTSLVAMVMPGAVNGKVVVTTASGSDSSATNYNVTASVPPTAQQGNKLVGTGGTSIGYQGRSVSISADGNTAIVGGYLNNSSQGAVWVYTRNGGNWSQQGSKLVGTGNIGNASQGSSVSLSADGNTALVGGYTDNSNQGAVWIFTRNNGVWSQQGNKLVGTGGTTDSYQGLSVSLSADGNTALVGGNYDNGQQGAAWVYTRSAGIWSQQGSKLVGTGAIGAARQGISVSISADGNTSLIGGYSDNNGEGAAWVFKRNGIVWSQQGNKLKGLGSSTFATQGASVSLSSDGNTAVVGGPGDNNNIGAAWVFIRSGGVWSQQGSKLIGTGAIGTANQGNSVSISSDGNTLMVGGEGDNNSLGATWVYTRSGGIWSQQGNKLVGTGSALGTVLQGSSVSISADGITAILGGYYDDNSQGAAWVFKGIACTPPTLTTSQTNISCVPNNLTGSSTVTATGGTAPYTYLWSNAATTATVTGLAAATYTVTVTATGGCSVSASVTITVIPLPAPVITGSLSICSGGSTTLNAGVYASYLWSTGASTQTINVSTAGNYTVTVTATNGCTASNSATTKIENFHELWSNNPAVNMAICTATNNQAEPKAISDGLGGAIITWYDSRNGIDKDIYVQRIDASGLIKWTLNGTAICTAAGDQTFPKIAADASGGAIITWQDYRSGNQWDVYAQRVNAAGSIMWAANGVAICAAINNQLAPNIINDSKGGVILTWSDFRNGATNADIYAQRITDLGVIKWTANGVPVCSAINNQTAPVLVTNGSGGAMIAWSDFRNGNADIYMQRINTNGIIQWAIDGLPICFLPDEINKVALVSDNTSGAIVTWEDYRNGTNNSDIYAQRINATGVGLWSVNGVSVCNSTGNQFQPAIISDGGKGAILTWRDKRNSSFDIYTQKIDSMGAGKWTNNGVAVCTFLENQSNPSLVSDFDGGAYITWQDFRNGNFDVYAQKVNSAGVNQFTANGMVIGNAANSQQYPFIISDNNGGAIVTWNDSDIYAQNINANGTLGSNYINPTLPVIAATSLTNCGVINTTLSISSGSLNSATNWQWYSVSCGGTPIGTGTSVTVSPAATTTYYVRGENSCVTPGSCSSMQIAVIKPAPVGLLATNITVSSAITKWDTVACAVGYKMQYRKQGVTAWTTVNINANAPTKTISGLLAATKYQWRVKSKFADGTYSVNSATASFTTLALRSGLEMIDNTSDLVVYPNPAADLLNLDFPFTEGVSTKITVINTIGQTVLEQIVSEDLSTTQLNIQSLTKGIYMVTVKNGDETFTARFIKE